MQGDMFFDLFENDENGVRGRFQIKFAMMPSLKQQRIPDNGTRE